MIRQEWSASRMVSFNMVLIVVSHTTGIQPTRTQFYSLICTPYNILHAFIDNVVPNMSQHMRFGYLYCRGINVQVGLREDSP